MAVKDDSCRPLYTAAALLTKLRSAGRGCDAVPFPAKGWTCRSSSVCLFWLRCMERPRPQSLFVCKLAMLPTLAWVGLAAAAVSVHGMGSNVAVTTQAWCANSLRIRAEPSALPPAVAVTRARLETMMRKEGLAALPDALEGVECTPGASEAPLAAGGTVTHGNLRVSRTSTGLAASLADSGRPLFTATINFSPSSAADGYLAARVALTPGDTGEKIYGLGQGGWTQEIPGSIPGCPAGVQKVVPLARNGQTLSLQQRKFHITIPFAVSSAGYSFVFNMPGAGTVAVGEDGGMVWTATAALGLDMWVSVLPAASAGLSDLYEQYADATGHSPPLREDAMLFWQSRNRYKSTAIALNVAEKYSELELPVGVLVVDYKNQKIDGDFAPNPACYDVKALASGVRDKLNATTVFSFWPEAIAGSAEYSVLEKTGCLMNADLGGQAIDTTVAACRSLIWSKFLQPRYYNQGVSAYWLDETDGEGTTNSNITNDRYLFCHFNIQSSSFNL